MLQNTDKKSIDMVLTVCYNIGEERKVQSDEITSQTEKPASNSKRTKGRYGPMR